MKEVYSLFRRSDSEVRSKRAGKNPSPLLAVLFSCLHLLPWVPEVFLACSGNFRCWLKADTFSAVGRIKPETALEKSLAPRVYISPRRSYNLNASFLPLLLLFLFFPPLSHSERLEQAVINRDL